VFKLNPEAFICTFYENLEDRANLTELYFETPKLNDYDENIHSIEFKGEGLETLKAFASIFMGLANDGLPYRRALESDVDTNETLKNTYRIKIEVDENLVNPKNVGPHEVTVVLIEKDSGR
jgi:hypothetical protein